MRDGAKCGQSENRFYINHGSLTKDRKKRLLECPRFSEHVLCADERAGDLDHIEQRNEVFRMSSFQ